MENVHLSEFCWRCSKSGTEVVLYIFFFFLWWEAPLVPSSKLAFSSDPRVPHWASSCHAFSNANDKQHWKPQIGPCNSACGVCWGPAHVGNRGLSPRPIPILPPPAHSLLCTAVIGTDVPLALHRATFPLIATLYADGLHLPQQLSPYPPLSPNIPASLSNPPSFTPSVSFFFVHHSFNHSNMTFPIAHLI